MSLATWIALGSLPCRAEFLVPRLVSPVMDQVGVLNPESQRRIESRLQALSSQTSTQIAVLIVPDLAGEPIELVSLRVAESWKLGQAETDRGALLLIAPKEKRLRWEIGQGLEGDVPDAVASRIIREVMVPRIRQGDWGGAITQAVDAVILRAEPTFAEAAGVPAPRGGSLPGWIVIVFILFIFGLMVLEKTLSGMGGAGIRRGYRGGWGGPGGWGTGGGFGGGGFGGGGGGFSGGGASGSW